MGGIFIFRIKRKITAMLAVLTLLATVFCPPPVSAAEEDAAPTADMIAAQSFIYYGGMNRILNGGERIMLDKDNGLTVTADGVLYAEVKLAEEYLGLSYRWDGKRSTIVFADGENEGAVVCKTLSEHTDAEKQGFFQGSGTYVPITALCDAMNWHFYENTDFWAISKTLELDKLIDKNIQTQLLDMGKTTLIDYDFEDEKPELKLGLFESAARTSFVKPCEIVTEDNDSFMQLGAITDGYGGLYLPPMNIEKDTVYELEFDATKSADFADCSFIVLIQTFRNGNFNTYVDGIYSTPQNADKWTHMTKSINSSVLPENADDLRIVFCTTNRGNNAAGRIMVDNITVRSYPVHADTDVTPGIKADKVGNWYILGETVTMTPTVKVDTDKYSSVIVEIYNSDEELVHTEKVSAESFNGGYKWTPNMQGYYSYQFYTVDKNGRREELNEFYTKKHPKTGETLKFVVKRQGIVVARHETKPMEERCDRLCVSIDPGTYLNPGMEKGRKNGLRGDQIEIADLMGFRSIRFHFISPDGLAYKTPSKANVRRGDFDFAEWDGSVKTATDLGFDLVLNVMGTPRFVSPYREGYTSPTGGGINYYAPVNIEGWRAYMEYTVNRYKDVCNKWEVWNEPHVYGGSVFWKGITSDFAEIMKTGYNVIKKYQPGDESMVALGGIGARRYTNFYEELVQTDAYDYYDVLAMHGWDIDPWVYNKIAEDYGKEPKPFVTTEMHMMLRASDSEYINNTEKEEAIRCITEFLKDFKYGALFSTFFAVNVSDNADYIRYLNKEKIYGVGIEGGAYNVGIYQPRIAAIALNTFFDTMGKKYDYVDEYLLANKKQNVVRVNSDGEDQLIVWNVGGSKSNTTELSKMITDCATENFKVVDWENRDVDTSDLSHIEIKPDTMYFISGLDKEKLDLIPSDQGDEVYTGKVLYNNTEKQKNDTGNILNRVVTNGSTAPLFDTNSFELSENIEYTEDNWRRIAKADKTLGDFDAKYALSVADDGMYLVVRVKDDLDNAQAPSAGEINLRDSVQFAFDTVGDRSGNGYMECYAGVDDSGTAVVYKKTAPYIGGDIISDFTPGDSVIKNAKIQRTASGGETVYKIFLPTREIYPYEKNVNEALHFSILVNQNDGAENIGFLEWGGGLDGEKRPDKFGNVWLDKAVAEENGVYYPPLGEGVNGVLFDLDTLEYADNIKWITDNINYVNIGGDDPDFKAKFAVGMTDEGMYIAAEVDDSDINMEAANSGGLWSKDSMQIAIDPGARGSNDDRIEMECGKVTGSGDTLYKEVTPFVSAEKAPDGYTQSKNNITSGVHSVTAADGKIVYKIFIPKNEFYQFNIEENDCIKLSVLFNQNKGGKRIGYLEWSSGIGGAKSAKQYGIINYR